MASDLRADPIPLREDAPGSLRVGAPPVLLELVVHAFEDGATPEAIVQRYPTLSLSDACSAIAYYLRHRPDVEDHLRRREQLAAEVERRVAGTRPDLGDIRRRLSSRPPERPDYAQGGLRL